MNSSLQTPAPPNEYIDDSRVTLPLVLGQDASAEEPKSEDRLLHATRVAWNRRSTLLRFGVWGAVAMAVLGLLLPNQYSSTTQLMPPENHANSGLALISSVLGGADGSGGGIPLGASMLGMNSSGALFMGILRSHTVEDRLVDRFNLRRVYWFARTQRKAREKLESNTAVSEDRKSGILAITVTDTDRQLAQNLARAYVEELDRLVVELNTSSAHRERVFLEGRLVGVKVDLDAAQKDFSQFASKSSAIDIKEQGKAMVEGAATVQGQLIAAESELKGLEQIYSGNNVRVRTLTARVAELRQQLAKLVGTNEPAAGGARDSEGHPNASTDQSAYPSIRQLPLLGVSYADLYRRTRIQEAVFESLTKEYEMAKVEEAKETPSVKVLDPANFPDKKSSPPTMGMTWFGFVIGLICGTLWILAYDLFEKLEPHDPRKVFVNDVLFTLRSRFLGTRLRDYPRIFWDTVFHSRASTGAGD